MMSTLPGIEALRPLAAAGARRFAEASAALRKAVARLVTT